MSDLVIWKYPFQIAEVVTIVMPEGARFLHVDVQHGMPTLWALVDPHAALGKRNFRVVATGERLNPQQANFIQSCKYLGTIQTDGGDYVWHLFDPVNPTH